MDHWRPKPTTPARPRGRRRRTAPAAPVAPPVQPVQQVELSSSARSHLARRSPQQLARPRGSMAGVSFLMFVFVVGVAVVLGLAYTGNL